MVDRFVIQYFFTMQELPTNIKRIATCWKQQHNQSSAIKQLLPTRTRCEFAIINSLLNITMTQKYLNPTNQIIEVQYSAPISSQFAIYDFFVQIGNHKVQGVIASRERANDQFRKAKTEAKYVSTAATNNQGFSFFIGNIMPNSQFSVVVCFMREVSVRMNTFYYICTPSFMPDSSTKIENPINPLLIEEKSKNKTNWDLSIDLKTTRKLSFFNSPSHNLNIISKNTQGTQIMFIAQAKEEESAIFQFYYTTQDFHLPSCVAGGTDTSSTLMLSFLPKFCSLNLSDAYKASIENQPYLSDLEGVKGEFIFLIDQSGSMTGTKIRKAKQSLKLFLKSLPEQSYFNVISFGSESERMFATSRKNENLTIQSALNKIDLMSANMGGTQIYEPLKLCLEQKMLQNYPRHIFILTDGCVINANIILQMICKNNRHCRVHSIGIGKAASVQLVQGCAQCGKGSYIMINENEDPIPKVINLLELALSPIINKFDLLYEKMDEVESIVPNPSNMPYIFKDQIVNFYVTLKCPLKGTKTFDFEYQDAVTKYVYKSTLKVDQDNINYPFVNKMAHLKVIKCLEKSSKFNISVENQMLFAKIDDYKNAAIEYSVKNKVLSQYTSFICIGGSISSIQHQKYQLKLDTKPSTLQSAIEKTRIQINQKKAYIQEELSKAAPIVEQAYEQVRTINSNQLMQISCYNKPPSRVQIVIKSLYCLINEDIRELEWVNIRGILRQDIKNRILNFKAGRIPARIMNHLMQRYIDKLTSDLELIRRASNVAGIFADWIINIVAYADLLIKLNPLIQEVDQLQKQQKNSILKLEENNQNYATFLQHAQNKQSSNSQLDMIIKYQEWNGSWSNTQLLAILTSNSEQSMKKIEQFNPNINIGLKQAFLITVAVVIWMQKYTNSQQYSLIIRKALYWLKNAAKQNGILEMQYRSLVVIQ